LSWGGNGHTHQESFMVSVQVRYIVHDVDAAIAFYTTHLGFHLDMHPAPAFAMLSRGALRLVLSAPNPQAGGGAPMPDGTKPQPGGWNRFAIQVDDLETEVSRLVAAGVHCRNDIVNGVGGKQILIEDPSGNPVELFQPTRSEARLTGASGTTSSTGSSQARHPEGDPTEKR
jgi:catechol 2,3-dioxygenase-like lactoylglutathione lyase family enzyme